MLRYTSGAVLHGSNLREALIAAAAILVAEGYPDITVVSGDREYDEQVAIFLDRYVPVGEVNGRRVYDFRWWEGRQWARISPAGTVAAPSRTAPHVARIAADLGWPYNDSGTAAHRRLQQIAPDLGLDWTGRFFGEDWHWETTRGVGRIDDSRPAATQSEEDDMYDDEAKKTAEDRHGEIIRALEKIHRAAAPFKVVAWGTGLVVYNPLNRKLWVLPEGYADLLQMLGLVGGNPVPVDTDQLGFATGFIPAALGELGGDGGDGFTSADLAEIKKAIAESQVAVTPEQLKKLTDAVGAAARTGGEEGAVKALKDLTFVVTAS